MAELYPESVIRKTETGLTAIRERDRSLAQKSRTLLILVDGIKTVQELARFSSDPAQAAVLLSELLTSGLVCVVEHPPKVQSVAAPARARPGETSGANATGQAPRDLKLSIRKAVRQLEDLLGPNAEPLCLQLEKCKSFDEFTAKVQNFRQIVASIRSEKKADEFVTAALN